MSETTHESKPMAADASSMSDSENVTRVTDYDDLEEPPEDECQEIPLEKRIETIEAEARKRWGDKWTIETKRFADGTQKVNAFHVAVPGHDVWTEERLMFRRDGELHWDRVRVREERHVEVLEHDEIPEELRNTGGLHIDETDQDREFILEDGEIKAVDE